MGGVALVAAPPTSADESDGCWAEVVVVYIALTMLANAMDSRIPVNPRNAPPGGRQAPRRRSAR